MSVLQPLCNYILAGFGAAADLLPESFQGPARFALPAPFLFMVALVLYQCSSLLEHVRANAMRADFSWDRTCREYTRVYEQTLTKTGRAVAGQSSALAAR